MSGDRLTLDLLSVADVGVRGAKRVPPRRRWKPLPMPCWCCRRRGARPAIAAEVGARRMAYVCSACAVSEELVRAFAAKQMAELQGQGLRFRRLPFIRRTVFAVVFADLEQTTEDGSVIATVPTGKVAPGGA